MDEDITYGAGWRDGYAQAVKDIQARWFDLVHALGRATEESELFDDFVTCRRRRHPTAEEAEAMADYEARGVDPH